MPKIQHTIRMPKSGIYKINLKVPPQLREAGAFGGRTKIVESLETSDYYKARMTAPIRAGEIKQSFALLLQELDETGTLSGETLKPSPEKRNKSTLKLSPSGHCCFTARGRDAIAYSENLAKDYFFDLIQESENQVEGLYTRFDIEGLESMLEDSHREIEIYGAGVNHETGKEHVSGKELMLSYLIKQGLAYSASGVETVKPSWDKFRRAVLEKALRSEARLERVIEALRDNFPAGIGWVERFDGFFAALSPYAPPLSTNLQPTPNNPSPTSYTSAATIGAGMTIEELCAAYLIKQKDSGVRSDTLKGNESACAIIMQGLSPDIMLRDLDMSKAKALTLFISRVPKGMIIHAQSTSLAARVEKAWSNTEDPPSISKRTFEKRCSMVFSVFLFAATDYSKDFPINHFSTGTLQAYRKKLSPEGGGREATPYTIDQLNQLFRLPLYTGHSHGFGGWYKQGSLISKNTGRYWTPLLLLYTGCRINEIAQLMPEDIASKDGIFYLSISASSNIDGKVVKTPKLLKNKNSERIVPIHSEIIRCGFLDYVKIRKDEGATWLFSEWTPPHMEGWRLGDELPEDDTRHGKLAGKQCLALRDRIIENPSNPKPCNHSFRHMFRTALRTAAVDSKTVETLQGWSEQKASMADHYGEFPLSLLSAAVEKAKYEGLNITHLHS